MLCLEPPGRDRRAAQGGHKTCRVCEEGPLSAENDAHPRDRCPLHVRFAGIDSTSHSRHRLDVSNAQIAVIGRQSTERVEPTQTRSLSIGAGGLRLDRTQHKPAAFAGFCAMPHHRRRVRDERDPQNCCDLGGGRGRLQSARWGGRGPHPGASSGAAQRSDRPRHRRPSRTYRQTDRRRLDYRIPQRRRCRALRHRSAARHGRA
jgi:hypothetical protein